MSLRRPFVLVAVLVASLLAACGSGPAAPSVATSSSAAECRNAGGKKLTTVLTRNLYLGADLGPAIQATSQAEFLAATTAIWQMVQRNDFHVRAQGIADEIAAARPELVGLQEAYTWTYATSPTAEETIVYDFVGSITDALAERGLAYRPVASIELTDLQAPILVSVSPVTLAYLRMIDHGVVLAREDVHARNGQGHVFSSLLPIQILGQPSQVKRGWVSVEVKHQGEWFTFVSTHLEAYHWYYRWLQAQELAAAGQAIRGRLVLVGDLNSDPLDGRTVDGTPGANAFAYRTLLGSGINALRVGLSTTGTSSTATTLLGASASNLSATTTSVGSPSLTPFCCA